MNTKLGIVLAITVFGATGCATSDDAPMDEAPGGDSRVELASPALLEALGLEGPEPHILFGCSNRQIRQAQDTCRTFACDGRGSNGIHFCDQRPPNVVFQCDCRTGGDPVLSCSLTSCPP